ncbi:hypothetical protein J437_LFUL017443 [Ladona fulva]|uniref:Uncharacterized protein n=1 Tax=Ladona fulva TaxID=123851 RepID=A0A8K0P699_LADFU|nr:hypothetical protein J437_LFUL017443 [Ladona fulva]
MMHRNGMMEIDRDLSMNDFSDAILIHQLQIDNINEAIKDKGKIKLRLMQDYADFRRTALLCEWEHKKMKMEMKDLDHQIKTLKFTKVTKGMLAFLCSPQSEDQEKLEKEMNNMKEIFGKKKKDFLRRTDDLDQKISSIGKENKKLDNAIQILSTNINEKLLKCDPKIEEKATAASNARMAAIVRRSHLVTGIQKKYNEILVLQTELEILRLKTFPTFRYTCIP